MRFYVSAITAICLVSVSAFAGSDKAPVRSTMSQDHCFKMPKIFGDDLAKVRATYEVIQYDDVSVATRLIRVEPLRGKIFIGARVNVEPTSIQQLNWARIALDDEIFTLEGVVDSIEFVAPTRVLGDSSYAREMNKLAKERSNVDPRHPVLAVPVGAKSNQLNARISTAAIDCPKGF